MKLNLPLRGSFTYHTWTIYIWQNACPLKILIYKILYRDVATTSNKYLLSLQNVFENKAFRVNVPGMDMGRSHLIILNKVFKFYGCNCELKKTTLFHKLTWKASDASGFSNNTWSHLGIFEYTGVRIQLLWEFTCFRLDFLTLTMTNGLVLKNVSII